MARKRISRELIEWFDGDARLLTLADMLSTCRPMGGHTEQAFRLRYLLNLPGAELDRHGNIHVKVPHPDGRASRVLWSCHTDTVHRADGTQRLYVDSQWIALDERETRSACLGADDTVGVWIAREMILAAVSGHYVFHYGEERGGIGSAGIVAAEPERFAHIQIAIALDRPGYGDVITHQSGDRCCSNRFARALAVELGKAGMPGYRPCDMGVYTDTAEYVGIVAECTNLSVGYARQHSPHEVADWRYAVELLAALSALDTDALPVARTPEPAFNWRGQWAKWDRPRRKKRARRNRRADVPAVDLSTFSESDRAWYERLSEEDRKFLLYLRSR